jgi:hypothetical protein
MKPSFSPIECSRFAVRLILFGAVVLASVAAAQTNAPKAKQSSDASKAAPSEEEIPQSVFINPANKKEGKDPFFPRSERPYHYVQTTIKTNPLPAMGELKILGISSGERPLIIINNVTFGVGDALEIPTSGRKIKIQCLEIDLSAGTALIQHIGGERRVLHFQKTER